MGCGYAPLVLEQEIIRSEIKDIPHENENNNRKLFYYTKITKLIEKNPFFSIKLENFESNLDEISKKEFKYSKNNIEEVLNTIFDKYFLLEEQFVSDMFKDVMKYCFSKFKIIIPDGKNVTIPIIFFTYSFLSNKQGGKKKAFKKYLILLLNHIKKGDKYQKNLLQIIIINLIQMFSFIFGCFFVFFTFLDRCNAEKYNDIIKRKENSKKFEYEKNSIIANLQIVNENMSPHFLDVCILSEINNKIMHIFNYKENNEELINLEDSDITLISNSIFDSIYINNFVEILFFGENHEY